MLWSMRIAEVQAQDFTYTSTNGIITITRYTGPGGDVTIPSTINGLPVAIIGVNAFLTNGLTSITLPNTVSNIGYQAFAECTNLTTVTVPNTLSTLGGSAFEGCSSLTNFSIPTELRSIEPNAFSLCSSLTYLTIPDRVVSIGNSSFFGCVGLTGASLPKSVNFIGEEAFGGCIHLTSMTIPEGVTNLGGWAFSGCTNLTGVYFAGDAPSVGPAVFSGDSNATVYYFPGTSGWASPWAGQPAVLWNPQIQTSPASFNVGTNRFGFTIVGTPDIPLVIEASIDLAARSWVALQSCKLTNGAIYFTDQQSTNYPNRFYRIGWP